MQRLKLQLLYDSFSHTQNTVYFVSYYNIFGNKKRTISKIENFLLTHSWQLCNYFRTNRKTCHGLLGFLWATPHVGGLMVSERLTCPQHPAVAKEVSWSVFGLMSGVKQGLYMCHSGNWDHWQALCVPASPPPADQKWRKWMMVEGDHVGTLHLYETLRQRFIKLLWWANGWSVIWMEKWWFGDVKVTHRRLSQKHQRKQVFIFYFYV